jgi:hypothetical protein
MVLPTAVLVLKSPSHPKGGPANLLSCAVVLKRRPRPRLEEDVRRFQTVSDNDPRLVA